MDRNDAIRFLSQYYESDEKNQPKFFGWTPEEQASRIKSDINELLELSKFHPMETDWPYDDRYKFLKGRLKTIDCLGSAFRFVPFGRYDYRITAPGGHKLDLDDETIREAILYLASTARRTGHEIRIYNHTFSKTTIALWFCTKSNGVEIFECECLINGEYLSRNGQGEKHAARVLATMLVAQDLCVRLPGQEEINKHFLD